MLNENFVILGAIINLLGGISYVIDTLKGKVKPNKVSWGLWTVAVMIAFSAEVTQGVGIPSLATFIIGFSCFLIFLASFVNKRSYWKISKFDLLCGSFSIVGLCLWYVTKTANFAILFSIFADLMAGIPTLVKSYRFPETENWIEYITSAINAALGILTLKSWTFAGFAFPLYILFFDLAAVLFIKFKLRKAIKSHMN